jgi:hypothetical protein
VPLWPVTFVRLRQVSVPLVKLNHLNVCTHKTVLSFNVIVELDTSHQIVLSVSIVICTFSNVLRNIDFFDAILQSLSLQQFVKPLVFMAFVLHQINAPVSMDGLVSLVLLKLIQVPHLLKITLA